MNRLFTLFLAASCLTAVGQYEVGDVGPAGGWIFYVDTDNQFEDWDYLESWQFQIGVFPVWCSGDANLTSSSLGAGKANSEQFGTEWEYSQVSAFELARVFDGGDYHDWYIPSKNEIDEIVNSGILQNFPGGVIGNTTVSSTANSSCNWLVYNDDYGWGQSVSLGNYYVLPVRQFKNMNDGQICGEGTTWDPMAQTCIVANPSDSNFDGCVQLNDLLDLLGAYGNCAAEESAWQCGDPLEYQGYEYATVQIGEQCWFAENLRAENYKNGDAIPSNLSDSEWSTTTSGAVAVYGEGSSTCNDLSPDGDACDESWSLDEYGRLYNWYAVDDARGLCPSGWHVPTDENWMTMEMALGMSEAEANDVQYRGTDQGAQMKTTYGWNAGGNGTNSSGFSGLPGSYRYPLGYFHNAGKNGYWWSSSPYSSYAWDRSLGYGNENVNRYFLSLRYGFSVRCIKDAE